MKCSLLLEEADVKQMIEIYFTKLGFKVKDTTALEECFLSAFPEGMKVEVEPIVELCSSLDEKETVTPEEPPDTRFSLENLTGDPFGSETMEEVLAKSKELSATPRKPKR